MAPDPEPPFSGQDGHGAPQRFDRAHTDDRVSYLAASPAPYHAVANAAARLEEAGFRQVEGPPPGTVSAGRAKDAPRRGATTMLGWYVPEEPRRGPHAVPPRR
ncbi:hypothetical protein SCALM49S_08901 [Streptomyces californicus]